jgi:hypothetical protein
MSKYDINLIKLAYSLLPGILRTGSIKALVRVLLNSLNVTLTAFKRYRIDVLKQMTFTGQVFSLERMLEYYVGLSEVRIEDGGIVEGLYFYQTEENKPVLFPTVYFTDSKTWTMDGFIVHCPIGTDDRLDKIEYLLDRHKFAGTKYRVVFDL